MHELVCISRRLTVRLLPVKSATNVRVVGGEHHGTHELWVLVAGHTGMIEDIG